jgi:predicted extracellular nuclease
MAAAGGQVALQQGTTIITTTGDVTGTPGIVDFVGASGAGSYEKAPTSAAATATQSLNRSSSGADTDSNAADFTLAAPSPTASGTSAPGGGDDEPPAAHSIAEIQGPGAASPLSGSSVTTTGVVTADYDTGGFNGIYIQDPKGNPADTSSDALFVFGSAVPRDIAIGDSVSVTGKVSEYQGTTELTPASGGVTRLSAPLGDVVPLSVPWSALDTDAEKEAHEGELVVPAGDFTVTDNYDANFYGSFTLAAGDRTLRTPTEYADDEDAAAIAAIKADNAARAVTLDDGSSANFNTTAKDTPLPYLTPTNPVRIGSAVTFHQPVVLEYRFGTWNLQPTRPVTDDGHDVVTFSDTRSANRAPRDVGGDIRLATFNVLNYFPTTGEEYVRSGLGTCTYYVDRAGTPITDNTCTGANGRDLGPRGAATTESLARQQAKIVKAVNGLGASIVSLEELENSIWFGKDRDYAIGVLVDALNQAAGPGTWAYAPSPSAAELPALADQDVIRTGFIYKPADVQLVGTSHVLHDQSGAGQAFDNAREPLAQGFKAAGAPDSDAFLVIVNHFKSKGSGVDDGTGQGNANPDRVAQAKALVAFASAQQSALGTDKVFFTGDFNAYSKEDPIQVIEAAGYTELNGALNGGEATYAFDGMDGSLDHVFANPAAKAWVTGVDVWQINAQEQVAFEYSRYNYNATSLYDDSVFRASDHNPEIVGLDLPPVTVASTVDAADTTVVYSKAAAVVRVTVSAPGVVPTGTVQILDGDEVVAAGTLTDGRADLTIAKKAYKRGSYTLTAAYSGGGRVLPGSDTFTLTVTNPAGH